MLQSCLFCESVQLTAYDNMLILNSAADPFVALAIQRVSDGTVTLAEDNITFVKAYTKTSQARHVQHVRHVAFHDYILHSPIASMDVAIMNLLYQPGKDWVLYGLHAAAHALKVGGRLYIEGAKERGILSTAKYMQELFGNVETLIISKGHRVLCSRVVGEFPAVETKDAIHRPPTLFAEGKLDEGTRLLLEALEVRVTDEALDIGCGAGFIGLHIARLASKGHVTMVDTSLAAVAMAQRATEQSDLQNVSVLPSDGTEAVVAQRFDLVATNPPFHQGGIQTTTIAEHFIRDAAQVLRPHGRFYIVANRFLKYEPTLYAHFQQVEEVYGDKRFKVLRALEPKRASQKPR